MNRSRVLLAAVIAAAIFSACGSNHGSTVAQSSSKSGVAVRDLESVDQLRTLFNAQSEKPRLIVLASPT
jgi:ABC-type oligopeptide transport system substrate-binding subunit